MADIFLELPDELMAAIDRQAIAAGKRTEDLVREIIEASAPRVADRCASPISVSDEPIVQAAEIEKECRRLGYRLGWRFITCPQVNAARAKLLLVTLNPGGRQIHGPSWSQEEGSAYTVESWKGLPPGTESLQRQVQRMFALLGLGEEEVFSAHYVPFRSPSWAELDRKVEAEAFAKKLWTWLQPSLTFERIVCIGKDKPGKSVASLFNAAFECSLPVGWGSVTADRYRLPDGRSLVTLPHLSRFGLFGRQQGNRALMELFEL